MFQAMMLVWMATHASKKTYIAAWGLHVDKRVKKPQWPLPSA